MPVINPPAPPAAGNLTQNNSNQVFTGNTSTANLAITGTANVTGPFSVTGNVSFSSNTSLGGAFVLAGKISNTVSANQNNFSPTGLGNNSIIRLTSDTTRTITGLEAQLDGTWQIIENVGDNDIVLSNENASSTAANRFWFQNASGTVGTDRTLSPGRSIILIYDGTISRWRDNVFLTRANTTAVIVGTDNEKFVTSNSLMKAAAWTNTVGGEVSGANVTLDWQNGFNRALYPTANITLKAPQNPVDGQVYGVKIQQPASGGPVYVTWDTVFDWRQAGAPTLSTAANKVDYAWFQYDSARVKYVGNISLSS